MLITHYTKLLFYISVVGTIFDHQIHQLARMRFFFFLQVAVNPSICQMWMCWKCSSEWSIMVHVPCASEKEKQSMSGVFDTQLHTNPLVLTAHTFSVSAIKRTGTVLHSFSALMHRPSFCCSMSEKKWFFFFCFEIPAVFHHWSYKRTFCLVFSICSRNVVSWTEQNDFFTNQQRH